MAKRNIISVLDMKDDMPQFAGLTVKLKVDCGNHGEPLKGKTLAIVFEKPNTRTRISFHVTISELGGTSVPIASKDADGIW